MLKIKKQMEREQQDRAFGASDLYDEVDETDAV